MTELPWPFIGAEALAARAIPERAMRTLYEPVYPGVYVPWGTAPSAVERAEAAWLWSRRRGVVAGQSAAAMLGAKWVDGFVTDEGPRDTSLEKMAGLKTLVEGGRLTAAMASQISDGASAVLLASESAVQAHNLKPRARIHHISARGADPVYMLTGPIPATHYALEKTGLSIEDIDTVEINEAFAPVVMAWLKETGADPAKVNPSGGAIALGHPLGATGAKLFATMLNTLERTGGRYGLQTMCEGGGTANVTIIERL